MESDESRQYSIGDTGPAGGLVFYDKGSYSDGWRYMEAAPSDMVLTHCWGDDGTFCTTNFIEEGRRNSALIIEKSKKRTNNASKACMNLCINGYQDWFVPSLNELDLIYSELKEKGLGSFKSAYYWSSSEAYGFFFGAWSINFANGRHSNDSRYFNLFIRPIRYF